MPNRGKDRGQVRDGFFVLVSNKGEMPWPRPWTPTPPLHGNRAGFQDREEPSASAADSQEGRDSSEGQGAARRIHTVALLQVRMAAVRPLGRNVVAEVLPRQRSCRRHRIDDAGRGSRDSKLQGTRQGGHRHLPQRHSGTKTVALHLVVS